MFRHDINMKRIDSINAKIFLISTFLNFGNQLTWEAETRGDIGNPYLWSCLLDTEAIADKYLTELKPYALTARKINSINTPGKLRIGINLNSLDLLDKSRINLKQLYNDKLLETLHLLRRQISKLDVSWIRVCPLPDRDSYLPSLAFSYPGIYASLVKAIEYNEICSVKLEEVFYSLILKAGLKADEAKVTFDKINAGIYHQTQTDLSYKIFDFPVIPILFDLIERCNNVFTKNVFGVFFKQTNIKLSSDIVRHITDVGGLSYADACSALNVLTNNIESKQPLKA